MVHLTCFFTDFPFGLPRPAMVLPMTSSWQPLPQALSVFPALLGRPGVPRFFSGVVSSITVATSDFRRLLVSLVSSPSGKWCPRARKAPTIADERMEVKHPGVPLARFEELLQLQLPLAVV
jgi:hypothetical protein